MDISPVENPINTAQAYSNHYKRLGVLVVKKHPELAEQLLAPYLNEQPDETDLTKIRAFYLRFCQVHDATQEEYTGPSNKPTIVAVQRVFVAAMIHLYGPRVFNQPIDEIHLRPNGFVKTIAETLQLKRENISYMAREVIVWEKVDDDFKEKVDQALSKLKEAA